MDPIAAGGGAIVLIRVAEKVIEKTCAGVGVLYEPRRRRKMAEADSAAKVLAAKAAAEAEVIDAKADVVAASIRAEGEASLRLRAAQTDEAISIWRQCNREAIADGAVDILKKDHTVRALPPGQELPPPSPDWTAEFFSNAQDVSNEEMQSLWARILAGEVTKPGSFSRRTLHAVRLLSKEDAQLFTRYCRFVWEVGGDVGYIGAELPSGGDCLPGLGAILDADLVHLELIGLISSHVMADQLRSFAVGLSFVVKYQGREFQLEATGTRGFRFAALSKVGQELSGILPPNPHPEYLKACLNWFGRNDLVVLGVDHIEGG